MRALSIEWFTGIRDPEKKKNFELLVRNSTGVLQQLDNILSSWDEELTRSETKTGDYANNAWAYLQAHRNGDRSRIRKLRELLSFLQPDKGA